MKNEVKRKRAATALQYIVPLLERYKFKWCISGGFACYLYGVNRPISVIDIDIETDKDNAQFKNFIEDVKQFTTLSFQRWITADKNYDNYVMEVTVDNQMLSICTTQNLKLLNKETGAYEVFYEDGIPDPEITLFEGLKLPLSPKKWVVKMKGALARKKIRDRTDISEMKKLIKN